MRLSKSNEKLLIDLVKNQDNLGAFVEVLYRGLNSNEESKLNARFGILRDKGFLHVQFADDRAYIVFIRPEADDYVEEISTERKDFSRDILLNIIRTVGSKHGHIYPSIWGIQGGSESIEWRQLDELEWEVRISIVADIPEVKLIGREIISAMETYNYIAVSIDNNDSRPRYEQTIRFTHVSIIQTQNMKSERTDYQSPSFEVFFRDFKNACLRMQANNSINKEIEDVKTQYIRDLLNSGNYIAQDQSHRGASAKGIQAGEVDLLINNKSLMPITMIEALNLSSIDSAIIKLHIDKMTKYDTAGLRKNILLIYTYTADFEDFIRRYIRHIIEDAKLDYPLLKLSDISLDEHSELRVLTSNYTRSSKERELLHVFINLPR